MTLVELQELLIERFTPYICEGIARKEAENAIGYFQQDLMRDLNCLKEYYENLKEDLGLILDDWTNGYALGVISQIEDISDKIGLLELK